MSTTSTPPTFRNRAATHRQAAMYEIEKDLKEVRDLLQNVQNATMKYVDPLLDWIASHSKGVGALTREKILIASRDAKEKCLAAIAATKSGEEEDSKTANRSLRDFVEWHISLARGLMSKVRGATASPEETAKRIGNKLLGYCLLVIRAVHRVLRALGHIAIAVAYWTVDTFLAMIGWSLDRGAYAADAAANAASRASQAVSRLRGQSFCDSEVTVFVESSHETLAVA